MSKTVKISLAAVAVLVLSIAGASFARSGGRGTEAAGGSDPGTVQPAPPGDRSSGGGHVERPCGTPVTSGSGPDGTVAFTPCPSSEAPTPHPQIVEPTPGMADVHPIAFERAQVGDDERTVTIDFWSGVAPCSVLDHIDITYGADAVTITLYEGHEPDEGQVACPAIALLKRVVITLSQPLGDRRIADGGA